MKTLDSLLNKLTNLLGLISQQGRTHFLNLIRYKNPKHVTELLNIILEWTKSYHYDFTDLTSDKQIKTI